jgi:hypothetical protein
MKYIKLITAIIASICLLFACSSNSSKTVAKKSTSNTGSDKSGDSTYTGNSSLAYTINGRYVAIKDVMHDGDGKNWMALFINEVKNKPNGMIKINVTNELSKEVFDFTIANKGSSAILHYSPSLSNFINKSNNEATYMSPKYKNYYADSLIVNITKINATHIAGTFAGRFLSDDDKPVSLVITDGSFDVPFTKDKDN